MIEQRLEEFMNNVTIRNDKISEYINEEKGLMYPFNTPQLLCRVDMLELDKEKELEKAKFEQKIEKKDYKTTKIEKIVPKYEITKKEEDKFVLTTKEVEGVKIYNVTNQIGIHNTYENKEDAFKLCQSINEKVLDVLCKM